MPKIIISKPKKEFIKELNREITVRKEEKYFVGNTDNDFHTSQGMISKKDLKKTGVVLTSIKKEFSIFDASFIDCYKNIQRSAQMIPLKDLGTIVACTGINKKSVVIDAGAGSGGLALFLANYAKQVVTYDIDEKAVKLVKQNAKSLGLNNIKVKEKDVFKGFDEKDVDVVTIDLPNPWNAVSQADKSLKIGGFLVSYSPQLTQSLDFVNAISNNPNFIHCRTVEMLERFWELEGRKCKPNSHIQHSGFLTVCRKIR